MDESAGPVTLPRARNLVLLGAFILLGCSGTEVGKIDFSEAGTGTSHTAIHGGHVDVWTHVNVAFDDEAAAYYHVKLTDGTRVVAEQDCTPFDPVVKHMEIKTTVGRHETLRYVGKMRCAFDLPDGTYDAEATLFVKQPTTLKITHLNLVFKQ